MTDKPDATKPVVVIDRAPQPREPTRQASRSARRRARAELRWALHVARNFNNQNTDA